MAKASTEVVKDMGFDAHLKKIEELKQETKLPGGEGKAARRLLDEETKVMEGELIAVVNPEFCLEDDKCNRNIA